MTKYKRLKIAKNGFSPTRKGQKKGQYRETANIGYTRHRTNKC
jgi:hypothetical protein